MLKSRFRMNKPSVLEPKYKPDLKEYMNEVEFPQAEVQQVTESILNIKPTIQFSRKSKLSKSRKKRRTIEVAK